MATVSFEGGGLRGSVRPLNTLYDVLTQRVVLRRLESGLKARGGVWADMLAFNAVEVFASLVIATEAVVGFEMPEHDATEAELALAFEAYLKLDAPASQAWSAGLNRTAQPRNALELLPKHVLSDEERADHADRRRTERQRIQGDIERWLKTDVRLEDIGNALDDWGLANAYDDIAPAWKAWVQSNFTLLPKAGGYFDQDPSVMNDFHTLLLVKRWCEIESPDATSPSISPDEDAPDTDSPEAA